MSTKHTPGPWVTNRQSGITYIWQAGTENTVAKVYADVNEDSEANARLIATAPELLWWLEYTCNLLDRLPRLSDCGRIDAPGEAYSVLRDARAAIAKATNP